MERHSRVEQFSYQHPALSAHPRVIVRPAPPAILMPSVKSVLAQLGPLPPYQVLAGICEDGLPLLLKLNDPCRAPVLIAADEGCGKTALLRTLVASAAHLHSPEELQVVLLANDPREWEDLWNRGTGHYRGIAPVNQPSAVRWILELAGLAERRLNGDASGPAMVLAIDDFTPLLKTGFDVQMLLRGLFETGPQARIWPLVTADAGQALNLHYWIYPFRTRLLGKIAAPAAAQALAIHPGLAPEGQFKAWSDERWIPFWTPIL